MITTAGHKGLRQGVCRDSSCFDDCSEDVVQRETAEDLPPALVCPLTWEGCDPTKRACCCSCCQVLGHLLGLLCQATLLKHAVILHANTQQQTAQSQPGHALFNVEACTQPVCKCSCIGACSGNQTQVVPTDQHKHKTQALQAPDMHDMCRQSQHEGFQTRTVRSKGLLSTRGALTASEMGSAASAPLKGVVVYSVEYTALGLAARPSSREGVLPSPDPPCGHTAQYSTVHQHSTVRV